MAAIVELGSDTDPRNAAFSMSDEDHTFEVCFDSCSTRSKLFYASVAAFGWTCFEILIFGIFGTASIILIMFLVVNPVVVDNGNDEFLISPHVAFSGYGVPHPSENRINVRVQTTGVPARDVLKGALNDLMALNQHVMTIFDRAVERFTANQGMNELSMKSGMTSQHACSVKKP